MLLKQKYITVACGKGGLGYLLSSFVLSVGNNAMVGLFSHWGRPVSGSPR